MSFKRKGPGILVSAALGALAGVALVGGAVALLAMPSYAQTSPADVGAGERAMEPIQLAIRSTIERAVLEMTANLYGAPNADACGALAQKAHNMTLPESVTGTAIRLPDGSLVSDDDVRSDPNRWSDKRDDGVKAALRGRRS